MIGRHDGFPHPPDNVYINASGQKPEFANREEAPIATLVLIPGLVSDAIVWQPLEAAVAGRMPVHRADLTRDSSIPAMAARLLAETHGPLVAVGHSLGGRVAMEMAHQAPDRIAGLVLANTGHHPLVDGEPAKREAKIALGHKSMEALADEWLPPMVAPDRLADTALMNALRAMVLRADADIHERQIRALISRPDAGAYMGAIACPVLLVAARQDAWSPVVQHEEIAAAVPDAELFVIEDAGHFAPLERPDEVSAAIAGWLERRIGFSGN